MSTTYKATIVSEDGKKVIIEIEDPNAEGTAKQGSERESEAPEGSFSFTDSSGKRLTITIAE